MQYCVSYSGSMIVDADNEDEAYEVALNKIILDDINAYPIQEDGTIEVPLVHR